MLTEENLDNILDMVQLLQFKKIIQKRQKRKKQPHFRKRHNRDRSLRKRISEIIGFDILPEWCIHHIDGDPTNNNLDNLYICKNQKEHVGFHKDVIGRPKKI